MGSADRARALAGGALAAPEQARAGGAVLTHPDPLAAMQSLAREWRKALGEEGAKVVAITGSTGKTSTKDILAALLRAAREQLGGDTVASQANLNTEIGLPLTVLAAPAGTKALVLEMAMRGSGQIAELTAIAQPEVGVIVNVGPVHLEQLGTIEAVAAAKAELIAGMAPGATAVVPAGEPLLEPHLRADQHTVTFGEGGDVELVGRAAGRSSIGGEVTILDRTHAEGASGGSAGGGSSGGVDNTHGGERITVQPSFAQSHNLRNLLAATAAARALGVTPQGRLDVEFSALRGERVALANGIVLINDCYNANPMSMRAALDDLAASEEGRRVAVLGDMLELGGQERRLHREIGAYARARGVDLLLTVGPLASEMGKEEGEWGGCLLRSRRRGGGEAAGEAAAHGRCRAREGFARHGTGAGRAGARTGRERLNGPHPDRGDGGAADLHLPQPEVHRVPAPARVRPAHSRGGPRGAPREGGHPDDGRGDHLHRCGDPVPDPHRR